MHWSRKILTQYKIEENTSNIQMEQQIHLNAQHILVRIVFTLIGLSIVELMRI